MVSKLRSWWQKIRRPIGIIGIIAAGISVVVLVFVVVQLYGTGFVGKTLWDWLGLLASLAIPVVGVWFTNQFNEQQSQIARNNLQDHILQVYIGTMSELLLQEKLRTSSVEHEVRKIAHARTWTMLRRLDGLHKGILLQFLYESDLINTKDTIIDLSSANLSKADLREVDLRSANLAEANLERADLRGTDLSEANLQGVKGITCEELEKQAKSLKGATMPDGTIHA